MVVSRFLGSAILLATLAGCAGGAAGPTNFGPSAGPMPPAPLPRYALGDQFFFSDGHSELVVGVQNGTIQWQDDLGNRWTGSADFTLPPTQRQTQAFSEKVSHNGKPTEMWPLRPNSSGSTAATHEVTGTLSKRTDTIHSNRRCSVDGTEKVTVEAGPFLTYRIFCDRYALGSWEQRSTIWYAPELGHPIRFRDRYKRFSGSDYDLVAVALSLEAIPDPYRDAAEDAWRDALESTPSGTKASWNSADGRHSLSVTPVKTFRSRAQQFCRQFTMEMVVDGFTRRGNSVACRGAGGNWTYTSPRVRVRMPAGGGA